jgi:hypothetical protein
MAGNNWYVASMWCLFVIILLVVFVLFMDYEALSAGPGAALSAERPDAEGAPASSKPAATKGRLKYRAVCPGCGTRLSRLLYFTWLSHVHRRCPTCGCCYTADPKWEHAGSALLGLSFAACFLVGWLGVVSWPAAGVLFVAVAAAGFFLFPYGTRFGMVHQEPGHEPGARRA